MSQIPNELKDEIPSFEHGDKKSDEAPIDFSALSSFRGARSLREIATLLGIFAVVFFLLQGILVWSHTPSYVFPTPIGTVKVFVQNYSSELGSLRVTAEEFLCGLAIGSTIGLMLAALLTLKPFAEKVIAPYVLVMVTTPMLALVPLLRLMLGFGFWPIPICVALASGPMVMINATTGFRRTDLAKIALARSYGANTLQVFWKIRIPLAMPMIIVGYMVGSIFGLLTSIGGEMVAASTQGGLGKDLVYYSSLGDMSAFGATLLIVAILGVLIYVIFFLLGKRLTSWQT
jgi:NitT/TauT family transport system permease protein